VDAISDAKAVVAQARTNDADCDGLLDAFDAEDGRLLPRLLASPEQVAQTTANTWVRLSAAPVNAPSDTSVAFEVLTQGGELAPVDGAAHARDFRASAPGRYLVEARAKVMDA